MVWGNKENQLCLTLILFKIKHATNITCPDMDGNKDWQKQTTPPIVTDGKGRIITGQKSPF
ncbi:hypothetical protein BFP72_04615 [Reichenbachiella sp. 5M10]|nr:hypothetical protein BFP72_04615 [Reichenbachiella sp. 5M10]